MFRSHSTGRLQVLEGGVRWTRLLGVWHVMVAVDFTCGCRLPGTRITALPGGAEEDPGMWVVVSWESPAVSCY